VRILYLLKHFPCLSQTFIKHEIDELVRRRCGVSVVSAIKPREELDQAGLPDLEGKIIYLPHDYLYRYSPSGTYSDQYAIDKARLIVSGGDGITEPGLARKIFDIVSRHETDESLRARGFLECMNVLSRARGQGVEHFHCDFAEDNVKLAFLLHQAVGLPFSVKLRAYDIFAEPNRDMSRWLNAARRVITISRYNKEFVHQAFRVPLERIAVIYDGIPVDRMVPSAHYSVSPCVIASVGRLIEKKGHIYLIDACRILRSRGIRFDCRIYGSGPMMGTLQERIDRSQLSDSVHILGARPHEEILESLESASVFVLPCIVAANGDRDATPNVLLEAMAKGIPVISTTISGIPEMIADGVDGLLVKPNDSVALAHAIAKIHSDPSLARAIRMNGRRRVEQQFSIERNIDELLTSLAFRAEFETHSVGAYREAAGMQSEVRA